MFFHEFKYKCIQLLSNKIDLFWVLAFPLLLGTMFYFSFANMINSTETFHAIPVAVCMKEGTAAENFQKVLDVLGKEGEEQFLEINYTDREHAESLLEERSVTGILQAGEKVTLIISSDMSDFALEQSILETFIKEYHAREKSLIKISQTHPENLEAALRTMQEDTSYQKNVCLTNGSLDYTAQYFFNLIAMACLYTSFSGAMTAVKNQANLSSIGARKGVSPSHKLISTSAELSASIVIEFLCISINLLYLLLILNIDFGTHIALVFFTALVGCILGVNFGFLIGCIGHISESTKIGILVAVSLTASTLSGLMSSDIKILITTHCPIINRFNPAALLSDCFYALSIYDNYNLFSRNIITLLVITVICIISGFFIVRRDRYASL